METKKKWYQKTGWIIALLILFFPVGLFLMWKYANWNKKVKWGISIFFLLFIIFNNQINQISVRSNSNKPQSVKFECIGPDGKRIGLSPKACEEFNNAWKNKHQDTSASNSATKSTTGISVTKPVPTNTPVPQTNKIETNTTDILKILKANASTKWGTDYEMVQYEYNNQVEAYNWVVAQTKYPDIMAKAKSKWSNDYEMVRYEYENQVKAYEWIIAQTAYPNIMASAKQKWNDDYEMVKYEYENQVAAYKSL